MDQSQGGNPFGRLIEFARPHKTGYIVSVVLAVLGVAFGILYTLASISRHWQGLLRPASSLQSEISAILILETLLPSLPTSSGTKTS